MMSILDGLESTATLDQIREAYKRLVLHCHPDKAPSHEAAFKYWFLKVQAAYDILTRPEKRALYDAECARLVLPKGWVVGFSKTSQRPYYARKADNHSRYNFPSE